MVDLPVGRVCSTEQAAALVGQHAPDLSVVLPVVTESAPLRLVDQETGVVVAMVTALPAARRTALRTAACTLGMQSVARMGGEMAGGGRTFGWSPRRILNGRESCRPASAARDYPVQHRVLVDLGDWLSRQFMELLPERATTDAELLAGEIRQDWLMAPAALWTSGVVNRSSVLPYHRDAMNFRTWSAMPTLRHGMTGGHLHLPEYGVVFPCRDGEVTWFCGRELVHGVTPMRTTRADAYRYSIVYYALAGMRNCRSHAEEAGAAARRRTDRERKLAEDIRQRIASR
jgi:hypothetical protein